ncbi:MAG: sensor histidine kinase [Flavobacteriales bacterium]
MKIPPVHVALPVALAFLLACPGNSFATAVEQSTNALKQEALPGNGSAHHEDPVKGHAQAEDALLQAKRSGESAMERLALRSLAAADHQMGLHADALRYSLQALDISTASGDPKAMAQDLHSVSQAYLLNGMVDKALEEMRNSLALLLPTQDDRLIAAAYRSLLSTLMQAERFEEVLRSADLAIKKAQQVGDELEEGRERLTFGERLIAQKKYHDALPYVSSASSHFINGNEPEQLDLHVDLCAIYTGIGMHAQAEKQLARVQELSSSKDGWDVRERVAKLRFELARSMGQWEEALVLLETLKAQEDSVRDSQRTAQEAKMRMTYQLDRKEKDNELLREENARRAELLSGQELHNRYLLGGVVLLLVLAAALVITSRYNWRMAQRVRLKNEVIRRQNEEIHSKNLELQRQNMRLAETLLSEEEKEMMIKEIHHRVKNNLQVVDSLLHIQGAGSNDPQVLKILKEAQGRIRSMAMVHEHIYRSGGSDIGTLQEYFDKLVRNILVAHGSHDRISVSVNARIACFSPETLMPLTLVVNELFTNSVKYAFEGVDQGQISIVVRAAGAGYELLFSDNGIGLRNRLNGSGGSSFGMELVRMLAEQLNGEVRFLKGEGTTVSLTFAPEPVLLRVAS